MGRSLNRQKSGLTLENHSPGCMWGLLHHLQHNRWNQAKKRITRKAHGSGKQSAADEETTRTTSDASQVQESVNPFVESSSVETKLVPPSPPHKNSMKSRLKSLITEEMYKKKDRDQRSASCPTKAPIDQTSSMKPESSSVGPPAENNHDSLHFDSPKPGGTKTDSCELCTTMRGSNYLNQSEDKQPVRDHTLLRDKLVYAIEQTKYDSLQESKLFMNALDLLNLRKEIFLKVLQDPSSSLANQLYRRRAPSLNKSVSFPASGPSTRTNFKKDGYNDTVKDDDDDDDDFINNNNNNKHLEIVEKSRVHEISDNALKGRDNNNNIIVVKRFKNLREKIKHVIRDRKKEKYRIIMDSVQHMIPYGQNRVKEDRLGNYNKKKLHKRTSSFDESYDRYSQLLDISSNKEAKDHNNRLRSRTGDNVIPRRYERILSLPNLGTNSPIQIDDSSNASTSVHADSNSVGLAEHKLCDVGLENNKVEAHWVSESAGQENLFEDGSTFNESADSKTWETASSHDLNLEAVLSSGPRQLDSGQVSENEFDYQEEELGPVSASQSPKFPTEDNSSSTLHDPTALNISTTPVNQAIKKLCHDLLQQLQVDTKNEAEFYYVRDVLELSGFTRDELLGRWHSTDHPLDPMLFDEVEGDCLVSQLGCSGNEEDRTCDHLLLFDLINEVLLDIHERSFYYWPAPLTARSHMHRMPRGYRVLEEVWAEISWLLSWTPESDQSIDDGVSRDLDKGNQWMNIQMDAEFVGLVVEDLIFKDLIEEIVSK